MDKPTTVIEEPPAFIPLIDVVNDPRYQERDGEARNKVLRAWERDMRKRGNLLGDWTPENSFEFDLVLRQERERNLGLPEDKIVTQKQFLEELKSDRAEYAQKHAALRAATEEYRIAKDTLDSEEFLNWFRFKGLEDTPLSRGALAEKDVSGMASDVEAKAKKIGEGDVQRGKNLVTMIEKADRVMNGRDADQTMVLDGTLIVADNLYLNREAFVEAVNKASATDKEKQAALSNFDAFHEAIVENKAKLFMENLPSFRKFAEKQVKKNPDITEAEVLWQFEQQDAGAGQRMLESLKRGTLTMGEGYVHEPLLWNPLLGFAKQGFFGSGAKRAVEDVGFDLLKKSAETKEDQSFRIELLGGQEWYEEIAEVLPQLADIALWSFAMTPAVGVTRGAAVRGGVAMAKAAEKAKLVRGTAKFDLAEMLMRPVGKVKFDKAGKALPQLTRGEKLDQWMAEALQMPKWASQTAGPHFMESYDRAHEKALANGMTGDDAHRFAQDEATKMANKAGLWTVATVYALNRIGLGGIEKRLSDTMAKFAGDPAARQVWLREFRNATNKISGGLTRIGMTGVSEGIQESMDEVGNTILDGLMEGRETTPRQLLEMGWKAARVGAGAGMVSGGGMEIFQGIAAARAAVEKEGQRARSEAITEVERAAEVADAANLPEVADALRSRAAETETDLERSAAIADSLLADVEAKGEAAQRARDALEQNTDPEKTAELTAAKEAAEAEFNTAMETLNKVTDAERGIEPSEAELESQAGQTTTPTEAVPEAPAEPEATPLKDSGDTIIQTFPSADVSLTAKQPNLQIRAKNIESIELITNQKGKKVFVVKGEFEDGTKGKAYVPESEVPGLKLHPNFKKAKATPEATEAPTVTEPEVTPATPETPAPAVEWTPEAAVKGEEGSKKSIQRRIEEAFEKQRAKAEVGRVTGIDYVEDTESESGIEFQLSTGKIQIDSKKFEENFAGLSDETLDRVIDEEINHGVAVQWLRQKFKGNIKRAQTYVSEMFRKFAARNGKVVRAVRALYGEQNWDGLSDYQKGMEMVRVFNQFLSPEGTFTEETWRKMSPFIGQHRIVAAAKAQVGKALGTDLIWTDRLKQFLRDIVNFIRGTKTQDAGLVQFAKNIEAMLENTGKKKTETPAKKAPAAKKKAPAKKAAKKAEEAPSAESSKAEPVSSMAEGESPMSEVKTTDNQGVIITENPDGSFVIDGRRGYQAGDRWIVQTEENREREKNGERQLGGDRIFRSRKEAIEETTRDILRERKNAEFRQRREQEAAAAEQKQSAAEAPLNAYLDATTKTPMQRGKLKATLLTDGSRRSRDKTYRGNRFDVVRQMIDDGFVPGTAEVRKIQDVSRSRFNRMDNREQQEFERRQAAAGTKTEYRLQKGDSFFSITKAEYDLATWLEQQREELSAETETSPNLEAAIATYRDIFSGLSEETQQAARDRWDEAKNFQDRNRVIRTLISTLNQESLKAMRQVPQNLKNEIDAAFRNILDEGRNQTLAAATPVTPAMTARHAELEAKHNAGTITPEETAEAERLVAEAAKAAGYIRRVFHGTVQNKPKVLRPSFEAGDGIFTTDNPDVAEIFRYEREYGNVITETFNEETEEYEPVEPGSLLELYINPGKELDLSKTEIDPQKFVLNTSLQSQTLKKAIADGYDSILVPDVEEGVGDWMEQGSTTILFNSNQVKSAEPFTGVPLDERFNPEKDSILYAAAPRMVEPGFYSQLESVITAKVQGRVAGADQLKGILLNPQNRVTADEIKWSGVMVEIDRLAALNGGKVPKEDLMRFLREDGAVRFEEVKNTDRIPLRDAIFADFDAGRIDRVERNRRLERVEEYYPNPVRFRQYQMAGGRNYEENVLAMPSGRRALEWTDEERAEYIRLADKINLEKATAADRDRFDALRTKQERANRADFISTHFPDVPNYVAHSRSNEREDAQGRTGRFIEEAQSDRHQKGRKVGYRGPEGTYQVRQANDGMWEVWDTKANEVSDAPYDTREQAQMVANAQNGTVPPAPFATTWPLQLFKRELKKAVDSGMEWIGWTTGETQAARYDLSKQVQSIKWNTVDGRPGEVAIYAERKDTGGAALSETMPISKVADFIGKDLAQQIQEDIESGVTIGEFEDDDLKVGGEGMKGFYDNILPKEVAKYVKQWGGKVEKGVVDNPDSKKLIQYKQVAQEMFGRPASELSDAELRQALNETSRREAEANSTPIWQVTITPEMKAGVEQGQVLFAAAPIRQTIIQQLTADGTNVAAMSRSSIERRINKILSELPAKRRATIDDREAFVKALAADLKERATMGRKAVVTTGTVEESPMDRPAPEPTRLMPAIPGFRQVDAAMRKMPPRSLQDGRWARMGDVERRTILTDAQFKRTIREAHAQREIEVQGFPMPNPMVEDDFYGRQQRQASQRELGIALGQRTGMLDTVLGKSNWRDLRMALAEKPEGVLFAATPVPGKDGSYGEHDWTAEQYPPNQRHKMNPMKRGFLGWVQGSKIVGKWFADVGVVDHSELGDKIGHDRFRYYPNARGGIVAWNFPEQVEKDSYVEVESWLDENKWPAKNTRGDWGDIPQSVLFAATPVTPQQDAAYLDAVRRGDMETARKMVEDAAKSVGEMVVVSRNTREGLVKGPTAGIFAASERFPGMTKTGEPEGPWRVSVIWRDGPEGHASFQTKEQAEFFADQYKESEPLMFDVTRDEIGNVIPLSERFNLEKDSILYAATPQMSERNPKTFLKLALYSEQEIAEAERDGELDTAARYARNQAMILRDWIAAQPKHEVRSDEIAEASIPGLEGGLAAKQSAMGAALADGLLMARTIDDAMEITPELRETAYQYPDDGATRYWFSVPKDSTLAAANPEFTEARARAEAGEDAEMTLALLPDEPARLALADQMDAAYREAKSAWLESGDLRDFARTVRLERAAQEIRAGETFIDRGEAPFDPDSAVAAAKPELGDIPRMPWWSWNSEKKHGQAGYGYQAGGLWMASGKFPVSVYNTLLGGRHATSAAQLDAEAWAKKTNKYLTDLFGKDPKNWPAQLINEALGNLENRLTKADMAAIRKIKVDGLKAAMAAHNGQLAQAGKYDAAAKGGTSYQGLSGDAAANKAAKIREDAKKQLADDIKAYKSRAAAEEVARRDLRRDEARQRQADALTQIEARSPEFAAHLRDMTGRLRSLGEEIMGFAETPEGLKAAIDREGGLWLHRSYQIFDNPDWREWVRKSKDEDAVRIRMNAYAYIRGELEQEWVNKEVKKGMSPADAWNAVTTGNAITPQEMQDRFLAYVNVARDGVSDHITKAVHEGTVSEGKPTAITFKRGVQEKAIRELWGEWRDPNVNAAVSLVSISQYVAQQKALSEIARVGLAEGWLRNKEQFDAGMTTDQNNPNTLLVPLFPETKKNRRGRPTSNLRVSPLDNLYGPELFRDALHEWNNNDQNWMWEIMRNMTGWAMMAKAPLSWATGARNYAGNPAALFAQGLFFDPMVVMDIIAAHKMATNLFRATGDQATRDYIHDLAMRGLVGESNMVNTVKKLTRWKETNNAEVVKFNRLIQELEDHHAGRVVKGAGWVRKQTQALIRGSLRLYGIGDEVWKDVAFRGEKRRLREAYPNKTDDEIADLATRHVRDTIQTYSLAPKFIQILRQQPFLAPFIIFRAEVIRGSFNTVKIGLEQVREGHRTGNAKLKAIGLKRLFGFGIAAAGAELALTTLFLAISGFRRRDEEDLRKMVPSYLENAQLLMLPSPERDQGKIRYQVLSNSNYYDGITAPFRAAIRALRDPDRGLIDAIISGVQEVPGPLFSEQIAFGSVADAIRGTTLDGQKVWDRHADSGIEKIVKGVTHIGVKAYMPGTFSSLRRMWKGYRGHVSESGRGFEFGPEVFSGVIGQKVMTADVNNALEYAAKSYNFARREITGQFTKPFKSQGTQSESGIENAYVEMNEKMLRLNQEMKERADAAMRLGRVPQNRAYSIIGEQIGKEASLRLRNNTFLRVEPSSTIIREAKRNGAKRGEDRMGAYQRGRARVKARQRINETMP